MDIHVNIAWKERPHWKSLPAIFKHTAAHKHTHSASTNTFSRGEQSRLLCVLVKMLQQVSTSHGSTHMMPDKTRVSIGNIKSRMLKCKHYNSMLFHCKWENNCGSNSFHEFNLSPFTGTYINIQMWVYKNCGHPFFTTGIALYYIIRIYIVRYIFMCGLLLGKRTWMVDVHYVPENG